MASRMLEAIEFLEKREHRTKSGHDFNSIHNHRIGNRSSSHDRDSTHDSGFLDLYLAPRLVIAIVLDTAGHWSFFEGH